jgi:hypothetical protein
MSGRYAGTKREWLHAGLSEVERHRPRIVQQGEEPQRAVAGVQVEVGHAPPEQRVALA